MKLIVCILGGIILTSPCFAWEPDPWSRTDVALEITWQALNLMDWHQTWQIADRPEEYCERNVLLGEHPSKGKVNWLLPLSSVAHALAVHFLPKKYRTPFQVISIGWSGKAIRNNWEAGLHFSF